jgi:hypothetical protein
MLGQLICQSLTHAYSDTTDNEARKIEKSKEKTNFKSRQYDIFIGNKREGEHGLWIRCV